MSLKITFLGAAQNVTGSCYLVESSSSRFLVDCGMYEERQYRYRNWEKFHVPPQDLDAIFLTHSHIDHCGLLPKLVRDGFRGPVYCTEASAEIAAISLLDTAHLLSEDTEFKKKRHEREGRQTAYPEFPLYEAADVKACSSLYRAVDYGDKIQVGEGIEVTLHDAGHILGSSILSVESGSNQEKTRVLFSGDLGRWNRPILNDPTLFDRADYVIMESTYGDRSHEDSDTVSQMIGSAINRTSQAGGNVIVPVFAVDRAQVLLYYLNMLLEDNRIPHLMAFLDSPMAVKITEVYERHPEVYDQEMLSLIKGKGSPFGFSGLKMVESVAESKAINHILGTVIIMAGSGMCTGGRIKHHLINNITRPESVIMFVGYQANGTLGRQILENKGTVRILGNLYPVKAGIVQINNLSAHADREELNKWLTALKKPPKTVFVTHAEPDVASKFAGYINEKTGWRASVPSYMDEAILS